MEFRATAFFSVRMPAVLTDSAICSIIHFPLPSANLNQRCKSRLRPAMCYDFSCISLLRPRRYYSGGLPLHVTFYLDGACDFVCPWLRQLRSGAGFKTTAAVSFSFNRHWWVANSSRDPNAQRQSTRACECNPQHQPSPDDGTGPHPQGRLPAQSWDHHATRGMREQLDPRTV